MIFRKKDLHIIWWTWHRYFRSKKVTNPNQEHRFLLQIRKISHRIASADANWVDVQDFRHLKRSIFVKIWTSQLIGRKKHSSLSTSHFQKILKLHQFLFHCARRATLFRPPSIRHLAKPITWTNSTLNTSELDLNVFSKYIVNGVWNRRMFGKHNPQD